MTRESTSKVIMVADETTDTGDEGLRVAKVSRRRVPRRGVRICANQDPRG